MRFKILIDTVATTLKDMALDPRAFPGVATEVRQLKSSASTPSLRSRESEIVPMIRSTSDHGGGNVRVVVRVRGFLPRGNYIILSCESHGLNNAQRSREAQNVS